MTEQAWWLYLLDCDGRLYTGITVDPQRRLAEHASGGGRAARFTRAARSVTLRYCVEVGSRSAALRAEHRLRRLPRAQKLAIIDEAPGTEVLLTRLATLT
ncbi:MAG: GIY-YIG nuclease family protein [Gammaproteobacteria bacterium]|nr:MAG: GIY-YIG nuclease family protein [Gammaproteobacteria bacterium]